MAGVLLDTTVLIDVLRGRPEATQRLRRLHEQGDTPYVCAINVQEITRGLKPSEEDAASRLVDGLREARLGKEEGRQAGHWRRSFARRGRNLAQADCLIAAAALSIGARLVTGNPKDFPMGELEIEYWPAGA